MKPVLVIEGIAEQSVEDSGQALILDIDGDSTTDQGEFVRLQSWCEGGTNHPVLAPLAGKRLRVTVEVVEGASRSCIIGDRLPLAEYLADFRQRWEAPGAGICWKVERRQTFVEEGNDSYDAFVAGAWARALELIQARRADLQAYQDSLDARGASVHRLRVVAKPISDYLIWELNSLRQRREVGTPIRIIGSEHIADLEHDAPLPEIVGLDDKVVYQVLYSSEGMAEGAIRSTDVEQVRYWLGVFDGLYSQGEDIIDFFDRDVAHLRPSHAR